MCPTATGCGCRQQQLVHRKVPFHTKAIFFTQYLQKTPIHNCGPGHYWQNWSIMKLHFGFDTRTNLILLLNTGFAICLQWQLLFVVNILGKLRNPKLYIKCTQCQIPGITEGSIFCDSDTHWCVILFCFGFFSLENRVMQENFSVVQPQIVETFVQRLMESYQESDTEVHILHFYLSNS